MKCDNIAYALDGPHGCSNITYDNQTCILKASCYDNATDTYVSNVCDTKCCEIDTSYRLPGNWTVYDNKNGMLNCRSDQEVCATDVTEGEHGGIPTGCRDSNDDDDDNGATAPTDDVPGAADDDGPPSVDSGATYDDAAKTDDLGDDLGVNHRCLETAQCNFGYECTQGFCEESAPPIAIDEGNNTAFR